MRNLPPSTLFAELEASVPPSEASGARQPTELASDPFALAPHGAAMLEAGAMLAPLVLVWDYRVPDGARFSAWLASRDILLRASRLTGDPLLTGVKYGGSYRFAGDDDGGARFLTLWGYTDQTALDGMHALCSGDYDRATIVQIDLIEFVAGLKREMARAGERHFRQQVLVAAPAIDDQ